MSDMPSGSQPSPGPLARALSAEVRSLLAERRMTAVALADKTGISRSYLGKRLRDEAQLTSNDLEAICEALDMDLLEFAREALRRLKR